MPRPTIPKSPVSIADSNTLDETLSTLQSGLNQVLTARAVKELLKGTQEASSDSSSAIKAVNDLIGSVAGSVKGISDLQTTLMDRMLKGSGQDSNSTLMLLMLRMMMNQQKQTGPDMESIFNRMLDMQESHYEQRLKDLEQRIGPGPADQTVSQVMSQALGQWVHQMMSPRDPLESVVGMAERVSKLKEVFGGKDENPEYSEGALRLKALEYEAQAKRDEINLKREEIQERKERIQKMPEVANSIARGAASVLSQFGFSPASPLPPDALQRAQAMYQGYQGGMAE